MKTRTMVSILIIVVVAVLMLTVAVASAEPVSAASKVKIKWDANGGKIGAYKTSISNVKKGAKIGKLPKTPKKSGYVFSGWYTKKSGGTKITTATKVKKKVTYYAQWKKPGSRVLNAEEKKLVGTWRASYFDDNYLFTDKGKFIYYVGSSSVSAHNGKSGDFKVSGGKITFTNIVVFDDGYYPKTQVLEYKFDKMGNNERLLTKAMDYPELDYLSISSSYRVYSKIS